MRMLQAALLVLTLAISTSASSLAQTSALDCVPPAIPYSDLPADVLADYRDELRLEYSEYFDAAQRYLQCLERAQATAHGEINQALETYTRLFGGDVE